MSSNFSKSDLTVFIGQLNYRFMFLYPLKKTKLTSRNGLEN